MADSYGLHYKTVDFLAADGTPLCGTYFPANNDTPQTSVLLCPATGVRQAFYFPFASWLQTQGHPVLVFDYRGIGLSLPPRGLKTCMARKQDWGEQDMPAALTWLLTQTGQDHAILIGHSAGAQLIGLMKNYHQISHVLAVSASSGYVRNIRLPMKIAALFFVWLYVPLTTRWLGYLPAKQIGWGENLPAGIARQWARWCRKPGYVENDFNKTISKNYYKDLNYPISLFYATDDPLATPKNIDDWLRLMPMAKKQIIPLKPEESGGKRIGHIDMFRPRHAALWPSLLAALSELEGKPKPTKFF